MQLNKDQSSLIDTLLKFYNNGGDQYFLVSGQAGVGKTTCMKFFAEQVLDTNPRTKICMSAPTNKAVAVLDSSLKMPDLTYKTIYSLLGLRMMANGEVKELADSGKDSVGNYDLVVIDEGSMVSSILIDYLFKKTRLADTKIVIIGDKEQLPPVGELISPIWKTFDVKYELTEVMRHQNAILEFVQSIRGDQHPVLESPGKPVYIDKTEDSFVGKITYMAERGQFHTGSAKAVAWRNVTVDTLNNIIRDSYPPTQSPDKFIVGDRVVIKEPIIEADTTVAATDEEGQVSFVRITTHTLYPMLKAWKIDIKLDIDKTTVTAHVIHEDSKKMMDDLLEGFKAEKKWNLFWKLKEAFHNVSYAYALTAHRSQGSTFEHVFVDAGDVLLNRSPDERAKCLYVACSRASKSLHLFV